MSDTYQPLRLRVGPPEEGASQTGYGDQLAPYLQQPQDVPWWLQGGTRAQTLQQGFPQAFMPPAGYQPAGPVAASPSLEDMQELAQQRARENPMYPPSWTEHMVNAVSSNITPMLDSAVDQFVGQGYSPGEAVNAALMVIPGAKIAPVGGKVVAPATGIRGYHSSPHDFDRFDISKVGTGQGAQSYGHGIYAAENPAVSGQGGQYWKSFAGRFSPAENTAAEFLARAGFDREKAAQTLRHSIANQAEGLSETNMKTQQRMRQEALSLLESDKIVGPRTYEVNINARPEEFLDWDRPLGQHSPQAQRAFGQIVDRNIPEEPGWAKLTGEQAFRAVGERAGIRGGGERLLNEAGIPGIKYLDQGSRNVKNGRVTLKSKNREAWLDDSPSTMERFFAHRFKENGGDLGRTIQHLESDFSRFPNDEVVKKTLEFAQSPAHKFRYEPPTKQTSNYVVFDDKLIDILRKYGIAGVPSAGALGYGATRDSGGPDL